MSVENLQRGLGDLRQAFEDRRTRKEKAQAKAEAATEAARVKQASIDLADQLSQTAEGQTAVGQYLATGIGNQLIAPEKAVNVLEGQQGMKLFYQLQAKVASEQDPVRKKQLMGMLTEMTDAYNRINAFDALNKAKSAQIGVLEAKQKFGVLKPAGKSGGGSGGGGGPAGAGAGSEETPTNLEVSFDDLPEYVQGFVQNDDFYNTYMVRDRTKGFLTAPSDQQDLSSFQERANNAFNDYLRKHPILGQQGMEVPRAKLQQKFLNRLATQGLDGFTSVGTSGDKMFSRNLAETIPMNQAQAVDIASQNQGTIERKKKGEIKKISVPTTQTPLFQKKTPAKSVVDVKKVNADDNYYLGQ